MQRSPSQMPLGLRPTLLQSQCVAPAICRDMASLTGQIRYLGFVGSIAGDLRMSITHGPSLKAAWPKPMLSAAGHDCKVLRGGASGGACQSSL